MTAARRRPGRALGSPPSGARAASRRALSCVLAAACLAAAGHARASTVAQPDDLSGLSLEELADVEVTSVSRGPQALSTAPAAIFVITAEDIRRSGAATLPEVLRLAPNLEVARIDGVSYAISARGFNSRETSNKVLVLIDGRSIYTPLYGGTAWDTHDLPLQDIERIEVISGPGGALYGANAVNGVINIITRKASDTLGPAATLVVGDDERSAVMRYGATFGETGAARVYVSAFDRDNTFTSTGADLGDDSLGMQAGFRADWGTGNRFTLQGDAYDREVPNRDAVTRTDISGFNLLGRWTRAFDSGSAVSVQAYYDQNDRAEPGLVSTERTWDLAVQYDFAWGELHAFAVGGGYRLIDSRYDIDPMIGASLVPARREVSLVNVFAQDRIALTPALELTAALKLEESSYAGLEVLPSLRLGWQATDNAFFWTRAARAVRTPSRIDRDLTLGIFLTGSSFDTESLWAYEVGYRGSPLPDTTLTLAVFFHDYDDLRTVSLTPPGVLPYRFSNNAEGETWGVEAWAGWDITPAWRLSAGGTWLQKDFRVSAGGSDITGIASKGDDPTYQLQVRSRWNVTETVEFDLAVRAVDELATIPSYVEAGARLGWRFTDTAEVSLVGDNLLNDMHFESDDAGRRRQIGRSLMLRVRWRP